MYDVIDEIKKQMSQTGVTQTELANRLGWSQPQVSAYLAGKKIPSVDRAERMIAALGGKVRIVWSRSKRQD